MTETIHLLFAEMWFWLWHGFGEDLFELVTLQRMLPVKRDQAIQTVEQFVLDQVVLQLATVGTRLDSTMADNSLPPKQNHAVATCGKVRHKNDTTNTAKTSLIYKTQPARFHSK